MLDVKEFASEPDASLRTTFAAEHAAERLIHLQNLALALTNAQTVEQAADVVSREGFAALHAPTGAVYLRDPDSDSFRPIRAVGTLKSPAVELSFADSNFLEALVSAARAKQPVFLPARAEPATVEPASPAEAYLPGAPADPDISSVPRVVLPLLVDDTLLGGLELRWQEPSSFDAEARAYMQIVAQMCAHSLERARLYEAEQAARRLAEQATERTARLQTVTARLSQAVSMAQVGEVIISEGAAALDAHRGVLALLDAEGTHLEVKQAWGYVADNARVWQRFSISAPIPLADVVQRREAVWLHDLPERNARYPQLEQIQTSSHAYAVLPLLVEERILGGISFGFDHARHFDAAERAFITALAQQCAQALERARLTDVAASRLAEIEQLNTRLQRALAETHHRVKNNLQVISALVELQTDASQATVPADALRRIGGHARALASLHDLLTDQAKSTLEMSVVATRALFGKMLPLLQSTIGQRALHAQIEDVLLPVRIGASLCLLVNELVSNAVKHGGSSIRLSLLSKPNDSSVTMLHMIVEDDGPGFPSDFDPQKAAHTGLDLVSNLSRLDLGGSVAYANNLQGGGRVTIAFPLPE